MFEDWLEVRDHYMICEILFKSCKDFDANLSPLIIYE